MIGPHKKHCQEFQSKMANCKMMNEPLGWTGGLDWQKTLNSSTFQGKSLTSCFAFHPDMSERVDKITSF